MSETQSSASTQGRLSMPRLLSVPRSCSTDRKDTMATGRNADRLKPSAPKHLTSTAHGDIDKILRGLLDAISAGAGGSLIKDDNLVVEVMANKRYVEEGELPGAYLTVKPL